MDTDLIGSIRTHIKRLNLDDNDVREVLAYLDTSNARSDILDKIEEYLIETDSLITPDIADIYLEREANAAIEGRDW